MCENTFVHMRSLTAISFALSLLLTTSLSLVMADAGTPEAATPQPAVPLAAATAAGEETDTPLTRVFVGVHIVAIRSLDVRAQSFFADFYLWVRFTTEDEELAAEIDAKLEAINGKFDSKDEVDRKQIGDQTYICYRITGTFFFTAKLASYPFDKQSLDLILENSNLDAETIQFVDDQKSYERGG